MNHEWLFATGTGVSYQIAMPSKAKLESLPPERIGDVFASAKLTSQLVTSMEIMALYTHGTPSMHANVQVVNIVHPMGKVIQQARPTKVQIPIDQRNNFQARTLTPGVYTRDDNCKRSSASTFTAASRAARYNLEQKIALTAGVTQRQAMRATQRGLAKQAARNLKSKLQPLDATAVDLIAEKLEAAIRRAMKQFEDFSKLKDLPNSEAMFRIAELFDINDVKSKASVLGALREIDLAFASLLASVDKTQQKLKPGLPLWKSVNKSVSKLFAAFNIVVRIKSNQPVQALNATVGMLLQGMTRIICLVLALGAGDIAHLDFLCGVEPYDLHDIVFTKFNPDENSRLFFHPVDAVECDASHDLSDVIFPALVLKMLCPELPLLWKFWFAMVSRIEGKWRSRLLINRQSFDHIFKLPSGVPWTFLKNTCKILKHVALDCPGFVYLVAGGDDGVIYKLNARTVSFPLSAKLGLEVTTEQCTQDHFCYHSFIHTPAGSYPDLVKCAIKVLGRRYPVQKEKALEAIESYKLSIFDMLNQLHIRNQTTAAMAWTMKVNEITCDEAVLHGIFLCSFASSTAEEIFALTEVRDCITLPTHSHSEHDGHFALFC
jgi:hypothetical protein